MRCKLVDVFAKEKLAGNGLTIFYDYEDLTDELMLSLTREMRQFESIFVTKCSDSDSFRARIFTTEEELDFAGHPIIGLGAHLHEEYGGQSGSGNGDSAEWTIELNQKTVTIKTEKTDLYYQASMNQGALEYLKTLNTDEIQTILPALNISHENLAAYPMEVISTGLPYLIVPIESGIEDSRITVPKFEELIQKHGAKFVYVLDVSTFEGRTWDNDGSVEDIATGSAAGPAAAYLCKHNLARENSPIIISQGRFLNRPSNIEIIARSTNTGISSIWVTGDVVKVADISFG